MILSIGTVLLVCFIVAFVVATLIAVGAMFPFWLLLVWVMFMVFVVGALMFIGVGWLFHLLQPVW